MHIEIEKYEDAMPNIPLSGKHIIAHQSGDELVVYQAYRNAIADYAVRHQVFGGNYYSYNRMSWIKPNFLWMMYRCGWAEKEGQERVLAIWIKKSDFEANLSDAVWSTYRPKVHGSEQQWKEELKTKDVRLQWDPDHDPYGAKLERRAIQLGLKGDVLRSFGQQYVRRIEDITDFVRTQKGLLDKYGTASLNVPIERVFHISSPEIKKAVGVDDFE